MTRASSVKRKFNKIVTERQEKYSTTTLTLDLNKCQGCNLCSTVCPRYAIERGPIGASLRQRSKSPPIRINYHKCVFCGLCAYICPFDALKLKVNDQPTEKLKRGKILPFLKGEEVICERTGNKALKFIEGEIKIHDDLCPSGCSTCIDICPTQCLVLPKATKEKPWEKTAKIECDRDNCLYCGACVYACPAAGAIELQRIKIHHEKEGSESTIWKNVKNKLEQKVESRYWFFEKRLKTAPGGAPTFRKEEDQIQG
ncbi:MAG: 4Fe-4S dicluster domain-containing protein [Candidatus Heimdallarchaeota archaeon]|nr:4Fe-4S dicluster domain-containing protein [Candidatus Heimdallarchaeota archaeon]